ncbi:acetyl-CoA decarbonylase/synthase complex subunit delta [Dehalococcoidia bacterium]|nr:acetyl-CoA decarbonylase/synthase complex subunit delta [Dehalococcoidia bacterium]MCL0048094.1 acetyl-CoA decarbonylase/synthase complex subunit delta [Dehalococcoidia bacterium]MCL0056440.1 acetyl-CoA decarbonylase/synthase complex subunit delta [Dehalococcoidia bacterium]MCL0057302.1 acetyl-CoA decarbonylase/synthase complex subunit delta [Dehalococcoidia bacterium]MCL0104711.1 acetyl-CoA decarbonylase/synthase complex subunit delta [Dehalococcoidia bacterium]
MAVEVPVEKWTGKVGEVRLGGDGCKRVTIGGANTLPFLKFEGSIPNPPAIAMEVWDSEPSGWPAALTSAWGDVTSDPAAWARKAVEYGADIVMLRLQSAHPGMGNTGGAEAGIVVDRVLSAIDLPLIVLGPGIPEKDNEVLVAASRAARGRRIALGNCEEKNYRTIAAVCISDGHVAIAKTPVDFNLAKQLNALLADIGVPSDSVIMDPDTAALGYGLEYSYSTIERLRLAALMGEAMCARPIISHAGPESRHQKESRATRGVPAAWGDPAERAVLWETLTATTCIHAGADLVVMCHPGAVELVKFAIGKLMG